MVVVTLGGLGRALQRGEWAPKTPPPLPAGTGEPGATEAVRALVEQRLPAVSVCLPEGGVIRLDFVAGGVAGVAVAEPAVHDDAVTDCVARALGGTWPDVGTTASLRVVVPAL